MDVNMAKNGGILWKSIEHIFYAFIIIFPFLNSRSFLYGGTSTRAAGLIFVGIVFGISFGFWLFTKKSSLSIPKSPIVLSLVIYFLCMVISGFLALDPSFSFWSLATRMTGIWYFIHLIVAMFLVSKVISDQKTHEKFIFITILSTSIYSFLAFLSPEGIGFILKGYENDGFTFGNSSFAAMYTFGAFLLSLYYLFQASQKKWWMYLFPIAIVINPFLISRNVWFGDFSSGLVGEARASAYVTLFSLIALFVIWLISKIKEKKTLSVVAYSLFGLFVVSMVWGGTSLLSHDGFVRKIYLSQATGARPLVWEISEKVIAQRPFFGWGTDNFELVFEKNYDNRLLQDEYGNEAWFDRAHNVFIDQVVDNGAVGLIAYILVYLVIILCLIFVALNSKQRNDRIFASVLMVYFAMHLLELQTAFDTSISYVMVAFMVVSAMVLFDRTIREYKNKKVEWIVGKYPRYAVAVILIGFFSWSFIKGFVPFVRAEIANGYIRTVASSEKRLPVYPILLGSPIDKHAFLWRTSTDFQRGVGENPSILNNPKQFENLKKEVAILEEEYRKYVEEHPESFRAHLNLADIMMYSNLFQVNHLKEAQEVLDKAIKMVPQSPQPYWMKAVGYIYMKKFDLAREYAKKAQALNPKIKQSQEVVKYVEDSIKTFPNVNLFFFRQI